MRIFSYLFHAVLALILVAISAVALMSGASNLQLGMLPWKGQTLVNVMFYGGLAGLITILLAVRGKLRILFVLWSLLVVVIAIQGYVFSPYRFNGGWGEAAYIIPGSLLALLGSWFQLRRQPVRAKRY
jgi:hypothetical protein